MHDPRRLLLGVQVLDDGADYGEGVLVVLGEVVGHTRTAGVDVGPAELFGGYVFARGRLHERRPAEEDRTFALDDNYLVAHRRNVGPTRRAAPHDGGDLGYAPGAHAGLVVEDASEVVPVREDLVLKRQESPAGVHQVDAREVVLLGDLLGAEMLLDRNRVVGSALDGGVVGDDHDLPPRDAADAGDDAGRRNPPVVHPVGRQRGELQKRGAGVEEPYDSLAHRQLAALRVPPLRLLAAPAPGLRGVLPQPGEQALENLGVLPEPSALRVYVTAELAHLPRSRGQLREGMLATIHRRRYSRGLPAPPSKSGLRSTRRS